MHYSSFRLVDLKQFLIFYLKIERVFVKIMGHLCNRLNLNPGQRPANVTKQSIVDFHISTAIPVTMLRTHKLIQPTKFRSRIVVRRLRCMVINMQLFSDIVKGELL
jgi:hypothetical protein